MTKDYAIKSTKEQIMAEEAETDRLIETVQHGRFGPWRDPAGVVASPQHDIST